MSQYPFFTRDRQVFCPHGSLYCSLYFSKPTKTVTSQTSNFDNSNSVRHWHKISPSCFCMPHPNSHIGVKNVQKTPPSRQHPWKAWAREILTSKMKALQIVDFQGRKLQIPWIHAHCWQKPKKITELFGGGSSGNKLCSQYPHLDVVHLGCLF